MDSILKAMMNHRRLPSNRMLYSEYHILAEIVLIKTLGHEEHIGSSWLSGYFKGAALTKI